MVIISMFMIGLFLIMGFFGIVLLLISLTLFRVNRHRRKKGMNPGQTDGEPETGLDGIFTDIVCTNIKNEEKVWYCSHRYDTNNAYPLPEEGQHFMDELNENP